MPAKPSLEAQAAVRYRSLDEGTIPFNAKDLLECADVTVRVERLIVPTRPVWVRSPFQYWISVLPDELVNPIGRVDQVTRDLIALDGAAHEREGDRRIVPPLLLEPRKVDAAPMQPWRSARLQPGIQPWDPSSAGRSHSVTGGVFPSE